MPGEHALASTSTGVHPLPLEACEPLDAVHSMPMADDTTTTPAADAMREALERHAQAESRVHELEAEQRQATANARSASAELEQFERVGGRASDRAKLEAKLTAAKAKAAEPWLERIRGAQAAERDARATVARVAGERFDDLRAGLEERGVAVAQSFDDAVRRVVELHGERERVASELSWLVSTVEGRLRPGDIAYSKGEALAHEAAQFLTSGGETPPRVRVELRERRLGATTMAASL
jgi:hypothetical protein